MAENNLDQGQSARIAQPQGGQPRFAGPGGFVGNLVAPEQINPSPIAPPRSLIANPNGINPRKIFGTENFELEDQINLKANSLANEIVKQIRIQRAVAASGRVFTRFEPVSDILDNQQVSVTSGLFSSNAATMSAIFTSSLQSTTSKNYYYEAWNGTATTSEAQFSVAYGHRRGSGSSAAGTMNDSPSRAVYSQYRLLLLNPGDTTFTFGDGTSSDSIYAINYNRARIKDRLDPGNWQMTLAQLSGSTVPNASHTGSNVKVQTLNPNFITLIDD